MGTTLCIRTSDGFRLSDDPGEIPALLDSKTPFWIDTDTEVEIRQHLLDSLRLHPLAVEDIFLERLNPKVEDYGDYLYVVVHGITCDPKNPEDIHMVELDLVLTSQWVFTHHRPDVLATRQVMEEFKRNARPLEKGTGFVAHAILDRVVDYYIPVVDAFDGYVDEVETAVIEDPQPDVLQRIFRLKRSLQRLRRTTAHQREVLLRLSRGEFELIPEKALPFYRDIHDHFVRVSDQSEGYRERLSGALDAYLSVVSNRMNEVMKALTLVATMMLPLTFIAGVYGMNFDHMPELQWRYGYAFAWGLMGAVAVGMIAWFRHKRWL